MPFSHLHLPTTWGTLGLVMLRPLEASSQRSRGMVKPKSFQALWKYPRLHLLQTCCIGSSLPW